MNTNNNNNNNNNNINNNNGGGNGRDGGYQYGRFHMRGTKRYGPRGGGQHTGGHIDQSQQPQQQQQSSAPFQQQQHPMMDDIVQQQSYFNSQPLQQQQQLQPQQLQQHQHQQPQHQQQQQHQQPQQQQQQPLQQQSSSGKPFRGGFQSNYSPRGGPSGNRGSNRGGRGSRGGFRGGYRGGSSSSSSYFPHFGGKMLKTFVNIPTFSGGAIIGVKGSLWGLINKATNARLKIFKTTAVIKCPDAQQLERAKEIVLKLKNTSAKYLSLVDYKGDQRLKFVHQPNYAVVLFENKASQASSSSSSSSSSSTSTTSTTEDNIDIQEIVRTHEPQFVGRFNEIFSTLSIEKTNNIPFVDVKAGKIWFLNSNEIPSPAMTADKYELLTESLDSVFQNSTCISESFVHTHNLFKEKKPYVLVTLLDTDTLDILTIKCFEEKVVSPSSPSNSANSATSNSSSSATSSTSTAAAAGSPSSSVEYRFVNPTLYKQTHHINAKVLLPQLSKQGHFDLRISIDTLSKAPLESHPHSDRLKQFLSSIHIFKNSNGNNTYQIPDSNLFIVESLIIQKVSIYRNNQKTLQFHLLEDNVTRLTTSAPEYNRPATSILCTSPALYDMFKSKNWNNEQVLDEIKNVSKNVRILISQLDVKQATPPQTGDTEGNIHQENDQDSDEE
ncbi:hypothetical protein DFA_06635 [Cavenderia fasciculata]|uniref:K Homology domain-containing protein n=1 Tax=Cavenderia fasciculata TaxID=261658 RepID=F4Q1U9_CACFS|nr:uncharacterized protein DFA_06635 [Cavenderia fasciculata]EGG17969.1 hypothetical protein DFA_06635 [Cavenderia fasciculata]|eukprot:XP_004356861.1 hypothetical protein DFA_06635 [Cavenderia fasciculata]